MQEIGLPTAIKPWRRRKRRNVCRGIITMVNYCVCTGCKNTVKTGHRVHFLMTAARLAGEKGRSRTVRLVDQVQMMNTCNLIAVIFRGETVYNRGMRERARESWTGTSRGYCNRDWEASVGLRVCLWWRMRYCAPRFFFVFSE